MLIPRGLLKEPDWDRELFPIQLTKENIETMPDLEERKTVSRAYEEALSKHYNIDYYWPYYYAPTGMMYFPPRPLIPLKKILNEKDLDTSLRSFKEVRGYHIKAIDGTMGHLEDLIVDDGDWQIVYVTVDTSNWLPWSKKVMLAIDWLLKISYVKKEVAISLLKDPIRTAPESNITQHLELDYEKALYDFYDKNLVKQDRKFKK